MRCDWDGLPVVVRAEVETVTGPVDEVWPVADGLTCSFAAGLRTSVGRCFVKGAPETDQRAWEAQYAERLVFPLLAGVSPAFRWKVTAGGWELMGFDWVDGRHADLGPGSADLRLVAEVMLAAQEITAPHFLYRPLAHRLGPYLETAEVPLVAGETVLHTDTNPHNLLVGDGRAWMVDWAMWATGPAWVDVAYTTVRLMEADTPAVDALLWAEQFPSWRQADREAVAAFVAGSCRQWEATVGPLDCLPSNRRFEALLAAVRA